ncbi:hypothetical protein O97_00652, partial [Bartonella henselae str. Zeus]
MMLRFDLIGSRDHEPRLALQ